MVPVPPMFTPSSSSRQLSVKWESKIAEGTLLMHWQDNAETIRGEVDKRLPRKLCTAGIRARLPEKIKNQTKVHRSG